MVDTKLSALPELAAAPAVDDEVYIRDISEAAADESKRILISNLMLALTRFTALAVSPAGSDELLINDGGVIKKITADDLMFGDAGTPTTQAFSDAAVKGTAIEASRIDHKHAMMAAPSAGATITGGSYAGNSTANRAIPHGLGVAPKIVLITGTNGAVEVFGRIHSTARIHGLNESGNGYFTVTIRNATNFYVGHAGSYQFSCNLTGKNYVWTAIG